MKYLVVLVIFLLDRITKELAERKILSLGSSDSILSFSLVHNYGAALGIDIPLFLLIILSIVAMICLFVIFERDPFLGMGFILGGLLGNLYDRVFYGYVIDFIYIKNFYVFNLADVFITVGGVMVFLKLIK
ncbi:MAG TPA: signal peptidase II [Dictyoglomaceae bacterium]|nr:signal peptidase II [Dictyoglomaceae bacterium]HOL39560.1 signal peptidase II [Dictyoglomaceae bacterium]HOP94647.1 signal peptidase II [Dictyoglomaceae bacterium]HPP16425.1 signal peptidase II [Dictyoglomaceae bacterium]HPU43318.1 signal peptidase II [Dictyoglomaceae bacterium]